VGSLWQDKTTGHNGALAQAQPKLLDVMTKNPRTVGPETELREAVAIMRDNGIGFLPVVGFEDVPKGVLTDRDIAVRAFAGNVPLNAPVRDVMTSSAYSVNENCTLDLALHLMETKQVGRVLVCNDAGKLTGVMSLGDAAVACDGDGRTASVSKSLALRNQSHPSPSLPTLL
jgi:CBS domain-containing protein